MAVKISKYQRYHTSDACLDNTIYITGILSNWTAENVREITEEIIKEEVLPKVEGIAKEAATEVFDEKIQDFPEWEDV